MKKLIPLFTLLVMSFTLPAQVNIPNYSFEEWTSYEGLDGAYIDLVDWTSSDYGGNTGNVLRFTPGYRSTYAAQMISNEPLTLAVLAGSVAFGGANSVQKYVALNNDSVTALTGYYTFMQGATALPDSATVQVTIYSKSIYPGSLTEVGIGQIYITENVDGDYALFTVPITYTNTGSYYTIDSASIAMASSAAGLYGGNGGTYGTTFTVDFLNFTTASATGVTPTFANAEGITLYPNPATNSINITNLPANAAQLSIADLTGKHVKTVPAVYGLLTISLDNISNGMYFYTVTDNSGAIIYSSKFCVAQ